MLPEPANASLPPSMVVMPLYVFMPVNVNVPAPFCVNEPVPEITPP